MKKTYDEQLRDIYCKGCHTYHYKECTVIPINKDKKCPCLQCLVKSMCVQGCDEFVKYTNDLDKETEALRISSLHTTNRKIGEVLFEHNL